eukprot:TRINITY_DN5416_c0_g1_i1.p1 TRINITY_DN5416_c0_g1~~TRINITY_DN5416_c0_g1_i1.p1  ORF type:complete len:745 (-),score=89.38 TRINITY_DN5416_c0_g1_i1:32-2266(-)
MVYYLTLIFQLWRSLKYPGDLILWSSMKRSQFYKKQKKKLKIHNPELEAAAKRHVTLKRRIILRRLLSLGLQVHLIIKLESSISEETNTEELHFFYLGASEDVLEKQAERSKLYVRLKSQYGGGYMHFVKKKKECFIPYSDKSYFNPTQKLTLIYDLIHSETESGESRLNMRMLIDEGIISQFFPLHDVFIRENLVQKWCRSVCSYQPLNDVKNYLGEKIALYFGWLGFYTTWLIPASIVGAILTPIAIYDFEYPAIIYSILISIWATCFLEFWKRQSSRYIAEWNMDDYEEEEQMRPEYTGEKLIGTYWRGQFIPLTDEDGKPINDRYRNRFTIRYVGKRRLFVKWGINLPMILTMIVVVLAIALGIIIWKAAYENTTWGPIVGGIVNGIVIIILERIYYFIAVKLNNMENHRTDTIYEDNLIFKLFLFQFINAYIALFYIAFLKTRIDTIFGLETSCRGWSGGNNSSHNGTPTLAPPSIIPTTLAPSLKTKGNECLEDLFIGLITIYATRIGVNLGLSFLLPWLLKRLLRLWKQRSFRVSQLTYIQKQASLEAFPGVLSQYNEMVIQFGYVTLFAAAFPLGPLLALINNVIEIRTDAFYFLLQAQRPHWQGAKDIGTWYTILDFMGYMAVFTNMCIIAFTERTQGIWAAGDYTYSKHAVVAALLLENAILLLKWMVSYLIADVPRSVRTKIARNEFFKREFETLTKEKRSLSEVSTEDSLLEDVEESNLKKSPLISKVLLDE